MRRTRILTTLGPASDSPDTLRHLLAAGTDAFRLNFSHGTVGTHRQTCRRIREAADEMGRHVAILQDLGGPKIRIGPLAEPIRLVEGEPLTVARGGFAGVPGRVSCAFDALFASVRPGQRLLIDDGRLELEVTAVEPAALETRVVAGGILESHKGINVPGATLQTASLTAKDRADLEAGVAMGVDMVALSFVQSAEDVTAAREAASAAGAPDLPIFAKIEKPQAVDQIDRILAVADGLIVARGDLGLEMPLETLPAVQKQLIHAARRRGVPAIVATQVLESMRSEPRPTRAEVTDAAHAVDQGTDAIMLAGETAVGRHPVAAVRVLDAILRAAERAGAPATADSPAEEPADHERALCEAAVALADRTRAAAVVAVTGAGRTARLIAARRPGARILAATASPRTGARLSLVWGVTPVVTAEATIACVRETLLQRELLPAGSVMVLVSVHPVLGREDTNFVHLETL